MADDPYGLSDQDKSDLTEIRKQLPAGDPRRAKLDTLLGPEAPPPPAQPPQESFLHSLGATFGMTPEAAEARRKAFLARPVASTLEAAGGPAVSMAEGAYQGAKRIGGELVEAGKAALDKNPASATVHAAYALPFVGAGLERGVEQLGPGEVVNPAEVGTALGTAIQTAPMVAEGFSGVTQPLTSQLRNMRGKIVETATGTGPRATSELVRKTQADNEAARLKAEDETTKQKEQYDQQQHETQGKELQHQRDVKAAQEDAAAKDAENAKKHLADRQKAIQDRKDAEQKLIAERAKQGKIGPTQTKLQTAWSNLRAGIETAREKALKTGNDKYSAVNPALNPIEADPVKMQGALADALESLKGSKGEPTMLKDFEKSLRTETPTYESLQGDYSRLGRELSKGTLPGDEYHAYDVLHDAIGEEMQRIADSEGMGAQLLDARNYWRRMKQAFGKEFSPTDAATKALRTASPGMDAAADQANRLRLIGSFDPDVPKLASHVENIQKGVDSLPKPKTDRELVEGSKAPAIPPRKPNLPPTEANIPAPPQRSGPAAPPAPVEPEVKKIGTEDVRQAKSEGIHKTAAYLHQRALAFGAYMTGLRALGSVARAMTGDVSALAALPADVAEGVGTMMGTHAFANLLESPKVVKMLTEPTARDLAQIPPELRGDLKPIVEQAQKQGIKVDPKLAALVGATLAGPRTRELQSMRK